MSRIFAIGDIHGELEKLNKLLHKLCCEEKMDTRNDKLIFLGDYVDRGPDSLSVLKRIKSLKNVFKDNVIALAGNHEYLMINAIEDPYGSAELWRINGGGRTKKSFHRIGERIKPWCNWLESLPLSHEEPGFFFSHAPIYEGNEEPYTKHELTWNYKSGGEGISEKKWENKIGVCGHIHQLHKGWTWPRIYDHYIYTDAGCGCYADAPLAAVEVTERKVILSNE